MCTRRPPPEARGYGEVARMTLSTPAPTTNATSDDTIIETIELTKVYAGADFRAVDSLDLTVHRARSSACSAPTAPARRRPRGCSRRGSSRRRATRSSRASTSSRTPRSPSRPSASSPRPTRSTASSRCGRTCTSTAGSSASARRRVAPHRRRAPGAVPALQVGEGLGLRALGRDGPAPHGRALDLPPPRGAVHGRADRRARPPEPARAVGHPSRAARSRARRSCSRRTTWRRPTSSAVASRSWTTARSSPSTRPTGSSGASGSTRSSPSRRAATKSALAAALTARARRGTRARPTDGGLELHVRGSDRLLARAVAAAERTPASPSRTSRSPSRPSRRSSSTSPARSSATDGDDGHPDDERGPRGPRRDAHGVRREPHGPRRAAPPRPRRAAQELLGVRLAHRDPAVPACASSSSSSSPRSARPSVAHGLCRRGAESAFATVLVAGVVGISIMFQGVQSVALQMSQEFGFTREIEDRVQAPCPIWLVAIAKVLSGAVQGMISAAIVLPIASVVHAAGVEAHLTLHWLDHPHPRPVCVPRDVRARPRARDELRAPQHRAHVRLRGAADHVPRGHLLPVDAARARQGRRRGTGCRRSC